MAEQINPWSSTPKMDINRLIADFGIEPFASVKEKITDPPVFIRRDIVAGHRGYNAVADAIAEKKRHVPTSPTKAAHGVLTCRMGKDATPVGKIAHSGPQGVGIFWV